VRSTTYCLLDRSESPAGQSVQHSLNVRCRRNRNAISAIRRDTELKERDVVGRKSRSNLELGRDAIPKRPWAVSRAGLATAPSVHPNYESGPTYSHVACIRLSVIRLMRHEIGSRNQSRRPARVPARRAPGETRSLSPKRHGVN